jgi:integrase
MHQGKVYTVSCDTLGAPPTKEQSYQAANAWWQSKVGGIQPPPPLCRFDHIIAEFERRKAWLVHQGRDASGVDGNMQLVREMADDDVHESLAYDLTKPGWEVWHDRLSRFTPAPADRTLEYWVDRFLALRQTEVKSGDLSVSNYESIRMCLAAFRDWCGADLPIDKLDADRWVEWYKTLQSSAISIGYKRKRFIFARSFIAWLVEQGLIPAFGSLYARRYKFGGGDKEAEPLSVDEVRRLVQAATGQLRLHLLLMANTGMTQQDISDLRRSEYKDGRITRRRSKTSRRNGRIVSWKLWDSTRKLLDLYAQKTGDHLLLTSTGRPWVRDELVGGKRRKCDSIVGVYRQQIRHPVPLRRLRQTSGDLIRKKFTKHVADHFLAHGQDLVDQAYFSRDQAELDAAVEWLGKEYGLA